MSIMILYHNDVDGCCSAAIAIKYAKDRGYIYHYRELEYKEDVGPIPDDVRTIYILDLSFDLTVMEKLSEKYHLVWIDHHMTAISQLDKFSFLDGKREDVVAACVLSWNYFFPKRKVPKIVEYIGDRDVWAFKFGLPTRYLHEVLILQEPKADDPVWGDWFIDFPSSLLEFGRLLYNNKSQKIKLHVDLHSTPVFLSLSDVGGKTFLTNGLKCNVSIKSWISEVGDYINGKADFAWLYYDGNLNGKWVRFHSFRSNKFNVGEFALSKGGGGHFQSSGFVEQLEV